MPFERDLDQMTMPELPSRPGTEPIPVPEVPRGDIVKDDPTGVVSVRGKEGTSSGLWIAFAIVFLALAGGAGWWLMKSKGNGVTADVPTGEPPTQRGAPTAGDQRPTVANGSATTAPVAAATATGDGDETDVLDEGLTASGKVELVVTTRPRGATGALANGKQSGMSPMRFEGLDPARPHDIIVSHPGYRTVKLTLDPEQPSPHQVQLEKLALVLKIESAPPGATLIINDRTFGTTPVEAELTGALAAASVWRVSLRKSGFRQYDAELLADTGFKDTGDRLVREFFVTLTPRPYVRPTQPRESTDDKEWPALDDNNEVNELTEGNPDSPAAPGLFDNPYRTAVEEITGVGQ
jgi:hypothetical protein